MRAIAFCVAGILIAGPAGAVEDYDACVGLIATDAQQALREATGWANFGGGAAARHCRALALVATGAGSQAIDELLGIAAEEPDLTPQARAAVLAQAGEMLMDEGDMVTARAVSAQALTLAPTEPDAVALGASLRLAEGDAAGAKAMLDAALAGWNAGAAPSPRLLVLRAAADRALGRMAAAREDAVRATELAPGMASAWLERGRVAVRIGDKDDARSALLRAVELDQNGEVGATARLVIQRMEAGIAE